jgi:CRISPR-associated protein Cst2
MEIKGILVSALAPFENHIANGGEKLLGNAGSIKRRPDGRVYVSGQMQRHVLFSAIDRLNMDDPNKEDTFVSTGDGTTNQIEKDLRADLGGFMHPSAGNYSGRRTAPLSVTPAVAMKESEVKNDLLVRVKNDNSEEAKEQALATKEFSQSDLMNMNFFLDVTTLSITKVFKYEGGFNIDTKYIKHAKDSERKRRAKLYLEATRYMNDYANQARNAVCGEPQQVIIVFDTVLSRKACRYFTADEPERSNILAELKERNAKYFIGDDKTDKTVAKAYKEALEFLNDNPLYNPAGDDNSVKTFAQAFTQAE